MKLKSLLLLFILAFLYGCGSYSELSPDPEVNPSELGYLELKDGDDNFELDVDNKYYIKFPPAQRKNFYLVIKSDNKPNLNFFLTDKFDGGEGEFVKIKDEMEDSNDLSVYKLETTPESYFWVIEKVNQNLKLGMDYRYVPIWRFEFESKYDYYKKTLDENSIDRKIYNAINPKDNLSSVNFSLEIGKANNAKDKLEGIYNEMESLEKLFPRDIVGSNDVAYRNFIELKNGISSEIQFLEGYIATMNVFKLESRAESISEFLANGDTFLAYLQGYDYIPARIKDKAKALFANRFEDAYNYYEGLLQNKYDTKPFNFKPTLETITELYNLSAGTMPSEFADLMAFLSRYELEALALEDVNKKLEEVQDYFAKEGSWPSNSFYPQVITMVRDIKPMIPQSRLATFRNFRTYRATSAMEREVSLTRNKVNALLDGYQTARILVPQINELKDSRSYKNIITLLNQNRGLSFLLNQYPDLDDMALNAHKNIVDRYIAQRSWKNAETEIIRMYNDQNFIFLTRIGDKKLRTVRGYEDAIFNGIRSDTKSKLEKIAEENYNNIDNVEALYADDVFSPVHVLTFSSRGSDNLARRKSEIQDYVNELKHNRFPSIAINNIYRDFVRNKSSKGVEKCRAIVTHGKYYKGNDRKIKNMIAECDPEVAKWITKAKEFRTVNAVPVTTNPNGNNEYLFKLQLQIPSDADFPVFDINIKLNKEIAENAGTQQWYKQITINKTVIKNEGRIKITSPTASNDFIFQVSPVQMDKDGNNILEVRFDYPAFKVFEVSCMAQKPIMKRN